MARGGAGGDQQAWPSACHGRRQGRGGHSSAPAAEAGGRAAEGQRQHPGQPSTQGGSRPGHGTTVKSDYPEFIIV